jgi:hypothetical protein
MDLDPVVKKHLTELDRILGTPAFTEKKPRFADDIEIASNDFDAALAKANEAEMAASKANDEANEAEKKAAQARGEVLALKNIKSLVNKEELKKIEGDEQSKAAYAEQDAVKKREAATNAFKVYQQRKEEAKNLAKTLSQKTVNSLGTRGQRKRLQFDLEDELTKPIIAKKIKTPGHPEGFLAAIIGKKDNQKLSISDCIDKVNELSNLKHSFLQYVNKHWNSLAENQKAVLNNNEYKNISDYLLAYGYWVKGITEVNAMFNFVKTHRFGAPAIVRYTTLTSARAIIQKASVEIGDIDNDNNPLLEKLVNAQVSFNDETFAPEVEKSFKNFIDSGSELKLINDALNVLKIDDLPASYFPLIIRYMRSSKVEIDKDNITYFLPIFINKIKGDLYQDLDDSEVEVAASDTDFDIDFIEDDKTTVKTNVSNVKCAAQLFSAAIMDMELDIFNLTNFLTNSYLIRNRIDLEDPRLRKSLETFVFSNKFIESKTGQIMDRTREGERQHFYRQVFNIGNGPVPQGVIVNHKFPKLWKQLIPAVKDYLENAASSLSENTFVSKGGVMQVVSGLHNNLSAYCTSMSKIISPIINGEWNFIITKILGHPEIIKQVSPAVGSWKGVVETLFAEMKHSYTDASLVYDKVKLSNAILRKVAEYQPRTFEDDDKFMDFCSMVIQLDDLNSSINTELLDLEETDTDEDIAQHAGSDYKTDMAKAAKATNPANNDWDF